MLEIHGVLTLCPVAYICFSPYWLQQGVLKLQQKYNPFNSKYTSSSYSVAATGFGNSYLKINEVDTAFMELRAEGSDGGGGQTEVKDTTGNRGWKPFSDTQ